MSITHYLLQQILQAGYSDIDFLIEEIETFQDLKITDTSYIIERVRAEGFDLDCDTLLLELYQTGLQAVAEACQEFGHDDLASLVLKIDIHLNLLDTSYNPDSKIIEMLNYVKEEFEPNIQEFIDKYLNN